MMEAADEGTQKSVISVLTAVRTSNHTVSSSLLPWERKWKYLVIVG
jgi:hypothetical protein